MALCGGALCTAAQKQTIQTRQKSEIIPGQSKPKSTNAPAIKIKMTRSLLLNTYYDMVEAQNAGRHVPSEAFARHASEALSFRDTGEIADDCAARMVRAGATDSQVEQLVATVGPLRRATAQSALNEYLPDAMVMALELSSDEAKARFGALAKMSGPYPTPHTDMLTALEAMANGHNAESRRLFIVACREYAKPEYKGKTNVSKLYVTALTSLVALQNKLGADPESLAILRSPEAQAAINSNDELKSAYTDFEASLQTQCCESAPMP